MPTSRTAIGRISAALRNISKRPIGIISGRTKMPGYPQKACPPNNWEKHQVSIDSFSILDGKVRHKTGRGNRKFGSWRRLPRRRRRLDQGFGNLERNADFAECAHRKGYRWKAMPHRRGSALRPGTVLGDKSIVSDFSVI